VGEALLGLLCFVAAMAFLLVVVAVVGHGIWLMAAALFGGKTAAVDLDHSNRRNPFRVCIGCNEEFERGDARCPSCGLDPDSDAAAELKDLQAAARTVQRLREQGGLPAETCEQVYQGIEARQADLLPRRDRRRVEIEQRAPEPIEQLETWLGADLGKEMSVAEKKQALAFARMLQGNVLADLSPRALVGLARLQTSVGMLSRASHLYQVLFERHAQDPMAAEAAVEAIRTACQLGDWARADELVRVGLDTPEPVECAPELAELIEFVRTRGGSNSAPPIPSAPVVEHPLAADVVPAAGVIEFPAAAIVPESPPPAPVAPEPRAPRRSFAEWIAVFMEERNILWGELIGGTLIVGCSIALVISLWNTLEQIPFFPFLIFAAITSALFGAGLYTLHHWKLESTSRGLLLIATLLVPLDFLVLAGLTRVDGAGLLDYVTAGSALAAFGWLLYRSSRILIQTPLDLPVPSALLIAGAMVVSAAVQLIAPACLATDAPAPAMLYVLSLLPVAAQVGALGWILWQLGRVEALGVARLAGLLIALGTVTFACCVALSYPLYAVAGALPFLSPALTLLGMPILVAGTLIHQKLANGGDSAPGSLWRTLGTGLGLGGVFVMFGGFAASVEEPGLRWLCGAINIGVLAAVAWGLRVPALHVPVQVYLASLLVYGWRFDLDAMWQYPHAALRLSGLLVVQAIVAEALIRLERRIDARFYAIGSGVSTVLAGITVLPFAAAHSGIAAIVLGTAALTWLAANLRWRLAEITYGCAVVLVGAAYFAFRHFDSDATFPEILLWSLLTHATICLVAAVALRFTSRQWLHDSFRIPLRFVGLAATLVAAVIVLIEQYHLTLSWSESCVASCWLAALWLTLAAFDGWPILFAAFQAALGAAWIFGAGGWLSEHGWDWREPYSLHIYGVGLAGLCLMSELARELCRSSPRVMALLTPAFVPIDRIAAGGLIVSQYLLTLIAASWSVGKELSHTPEAWRMLPAAWHDHAYAVAAWLVPVLLAMVMIFWLREFEMTVPLLGLTLMLLTVPVLIAGACFDDTLAAASAARWGLAFCYGLVSAALWFRHRLTGGRGDHVPAPAIRGLLAAAAIAPVLLITLHVVAPRLAGLTLPGPLDESVFRTMGGAISLLVPLAVLSAALAGHGWRERRAYYLLAAGLLADASAVGGYFLALQRQGIPLGEPWIVVDALLLAAGVAWVWSLVWTWSASLLERGEERPLLDSVLLTVNGLLGAALFAGVLLPALDWIMFRSAEDGRLWTQAAGSAWSWLVFALTSAGACCLFWKRRGVLPLHVLGVLSLTAVGVCACSVAIPEIGDPFLALMLLCGGYASVWVWSHLFIDPDRPPGWLGVTAGRPERAIYASIAGAAAVLLGCNSLVTDTRSVWAAGSIGLSAFACALLAYQRRSEIWASLASMLLLPAATILVRHFDAGNPHLGMLTIQVNVAVVGATALLRLGLRRFLTAADVEPSPSWQLAVQIALGMAANLVLLGFALMVLAAMPDAPGEWLDLHASWAGWLALATNAVAAIWYVGLIRPAAVVHALALAGLLLGVVLAGTADQWLAGVWIAHHVLTLSWTLLALLLLIVSWASHGQDALGPQFWPAERRTRLAEFLRRCFPEAAARAWVSLCGAFVVVLALRAAWVEPGSPYWSIGNTLAVSVLLGALAVWARSAFYTFASGLLFNVIGFLVFTAWSAHRLNAPGPMLANDEWFSYFVLAQILSFGVAAIVWSVVERNLHRLGIELSEDIALPFTQAALLAGVHLMVIGVGFANGLHLSGEEVRIAMPLAWIALGVLTAAALAELWRPGFCRFTRFHVYTCGLLALGLFLHGRSLPIADWYWTATLLLAGYVLLIVAIRRLIDVSPRVQKLLHIADQPKPHSGWFWHVQLGTIGLAAALSVWITLTFAGWQDRLGGPLACGLVTLAAFLLVEAWPRLFPTDGDEPASLLRFLTLTLGGFVVLEAGWACLDPTLTAIWLQRGAITLTVVGAATLVYRFGLPRLIGTGAWMDSARRLSAILAVGSVLVLLLLLGQEFLAYNPQPEVRKTPLRVELAVLSSLAILGLAALSVTSVLTRDADPYGIEGDRRSAYVYVAELLVLALLTHLRLNIPDIIPPVLGRYWYLSVMVLAFLALAAGEICTRRGWPLFETPMKRTALVLAAVPVLFFRMTMLAEPLKPLAERIPGLVPFIAYLERMGGQYAMEALCWLLLGVFFGCLARLRESANLGIAAALAVNFGVWVLLGHQDATAFLHRPQLWLIPLGLIVLVAEYINRERLGFWPSLSVRYVGLMCIYLSSMFEMFSHGLRGAVVLPIVLALLAVAGMLLGILFRVRAFLLVGFLALLTVVFAQIWNAAVCHSQTWVWWACGIVLGVIILALFAVFEKHRNEVLRMVDNMKRWH
jgi:hypothetical protein